MWFRQSKWYCFTDDEFGPVPFRTVVKDYEEGTLQDGDLVRKAEQTRWQKIETVEVITTAVARRRNRLNRRRSVVEMSHLWKWIMATFSR